MKLSDDGTTSVGMTAFTEDGALLAYGLGEAGSDWREFHVMEVASGEKLDDHLRWIKFSGASWTHDNGGFFYSRYPEPDPDAAQGGINRNQTVWYHALGTGAGRRHPDLRQRRIPGTAWWAPRFPDDGRYAVFWISEGTDQRNRVHVAGPGAAGITELRRRDRARPRRVRRHLRLPRQRRRALLLPDRQRRRHATGWWRSTSGARIPGNWLEIVPESEDTLLMARIVGDRFVLGYLDDAKSRLAVHTMDGAFERDVAASRHRLGRTVERDPEGRGPPLHLRLVPLPAVGLPLRPRLGRNRAALGPRGSLRLRAVRDQPGVLRLGGRHPDSHVPHPPEGHVARRGQPDPALRLRRVQHQPAAELQFRRTSCSSSAAGSTRRPTCGAAGEYGESWHRAGMLENKQNGLRRLHRRGGVPDPRLGHPAVPPRHRGAVRTAACSSERC